MKTLINRIGTAAVILASSLASFAQEEDKALLKQVEQDDQTAVDAIAMYPRDIRTDIFEAAKYPEVLVRMNAMQKQTKQKFVDLLAPYPKEEQEKIWDLTRYQALIRDLVAEAPLSEKDVEGIIQYYPEEIRPVAKEEAMKNYPLLVKIDQQIRVSEKYFDHILVGYPKETVMAYRTLIDYPDVLNTLYDNMQLTVVIGDVYKHDPLYILHKSDSLNQVLSLRKEEETADWKKSLNENPDAMKEYEQAAQDYARENGYTPEEYAAPLNPDIYSYPTYSYNWWFGYPVWYPYAYWNPYPFYADWGFYYGPHHSIIFFGMPSIYFMDWYFYYPEHFYHYPIFADHCYSYYGRHDGGHHWNSVSRGVYEWRSRNGDVVNGEWDRHQGSRVQQFKEYGRMESDRITYNKTNPSHPLERSTYLQQNQAKYPNLKASAVVNTPNSSFNRNAGPGETPQLKPHVQVPESYRSDRVAPATGANERIQGVSPRTQPSGGRDIPPSNGRSPGRGLPQQNNGVRAVPGGRSNEFNNAQQYHQNIWQQMRPAAPQRYTPPAAPRSTFRAPAGGGGGGRHR
jgi:hypothetical protein